MLALWLAARAGASSACPVLLVSGAADPDVVSVTFRDIGKLPIRRLEFNCKLEARTHPAQHSQCYEPNASFMPQTEYTVKYSYARGLRGPVLVSLKSVTFSDGHTWKPSQRDPCRVLKIRLPRAR